MIILSITFREQTRISYGNVRDPTHGEKKQTHKTKETTQICLCNCRTNPRTEMIHFSDQNTALSVVYHTRRTIRIRLLTIRPSLIRTLGYLSHDRIDSRIRTCRKKQHDQRDRNPTTRDKNRFASNFVFHRV